jgi:hypothetical protein
MTSLPGGHHHHHGRHNHGHDHDGQGRDGHDNDGHDRILPLSQKVNDLISSRVRGDLIGEAPTITAGTHTSFATITAGHGHEGRPALRPETVSALPGAADDRHISLFAYNPEYGDVSFKHDQNATFHAASGNSTLAAGNWTLTGNNDGSHSPPDMTTRGAAASNLVAAMTVHGALVGAAEAGPNIGQIAGAVNYTLSDRVRIAFTDSDHHIASVILRLPGQ